MIYLDLRISLIYDKLSASKRQHQCSRALTLNHGLIQIGIWKVTLWLLRSLFFVRTLILICFLEQNQIFFRCHKPCMTSLCSQHFLIVARFHLLQILFIAINDARSIIIVRFWLTIVEEFVHGFYGRCMHCIVLLEFVSLVDTWLCVDDSCHEFQIFIGKLLVHDVELVSRVRDWLDVSCLFSLEI